MTTMRQSSSFLKHHTAKMGDTEALPGQLSFLEVMLKEKVSCFNEILLAVSKSPEPEKRLIQVVQNICKLHAVNPATSAAGERSFSSARRLKTWLRSRMGGERFSNLAALNGHKQITDSVSIADVAQEFVSRNENRKRNFGEQLQDEARVRNVFNTITVLDSKTSEDVYVILIEVENKMTRKCKINHAHFLSVCLHWPDFLALPL